MTTHLSPDSICACLHRLHGVVAGQGIEIFMLVQCIDEGNTLHSVTFVGICRRMSVTDFRGVCT